MKLTNHLSVRAEHVRANETGHTAGNRAAQNNQITESNFTAPNPLIGWHALGNNAKDQQQKTAKKRQRGRIDAYLATHLALLVAIGLLIVGGLTHA